MAQLWLWQQKQSWRKKKTHGDLLALRGVIKQNVCAWISFFLLSKPFGFLCFFFFLFFSSQVSLVWRDDSILKFSLNFFSCQAVSFSRLVCEIQVLGAESVLTSFLRINFVDSDCLCIWVIIMIMVLCGVNTAAASHSMCSQCKTIQKNSSHYNLLVQGS